MRALDRCCRARTPRRGLATATGQRPGRLVRALGLRLAPRSKPLVAAQRCCYCRFVAVAATVN